MKYIGTSLGRCLRSLMLKEVSLDDVFLIATGTRSQNLEEYLTIVKHYYRDNYYDNYALSSWTWDEVAQVASYLYENGKIHQPRNFDAEPFFLSINPLWIEIFPPHLLQKPATKDLWEKLRTVARLSE
jgi:hypothetical protein